MHRYVSLSIEMEVCVVACLVGAASWAISSLSTLDREGSRELCCSWLISSIANKILRTSQALSEISRSLTALPL